MLLSFITPQKPISCPRLWKDFSAGSVRTAQLTITGLGLYRAWLNGKRVGADYLTPGFNDYDAYLRYQTYDITSLLAADNHLEVWLGNGWYKGRLGLEGDGLNRWGDRYLLAARLTMIDGQGRETVLETDASWLAAASPLVDGSIYDGEIRDDTRALGEPVPCVPVKTAYQLEPQFSAPIRVKAERKPTLLLTPKHAGVHSPSRFA